MKKIAVILIPIIIVAVITISSIVLVKTNTVNMDFAKKGKTVFRYNDSNIEYSLSEQEKSLICDLFSGKRKYKDNPSCGFSDDIAIILNDSQTFCIARDTCPIIYWKEEDKYFKITEKEKNELYTLLSDCGFVFPCI